MAWLSDTGVPCWEVPDSTMGRERRWGVCRAFPGSPRGICSWLLGGMRDGRGTASERENSIGPEIF